MVIPVALLNKTINIGTFSFTYDDFGDNTESLELGAVDVKIRLTRNKDYVPGVTKESGYYAVSELKGFIIPSVEVSVGDYIFDQSDYKVYEVTHINSVPGGVTDHHQELFLKKVENKEFDNLIYDVELTSLTSISFELDCLTIVPTKIRLKMGDSTDESTWSWEDVETTAVTHNRSYTVTGLSENTKYFFKVYLYYPDDIQGMIYSNRFSITTGTIGLDDMGELVRE